MNVHDIGALPPGGLSYSAIIPVDLSAIRRPCGGTGGGPKIARIRAVLSWNTPPSTIDPEVLNHWGNRQDAHVQLRPGEPVQGQQPMISIIGGIGIDDINVSGNGMTKPKATFALGGSPADQSMMKRECPFGGLIIVHGPPRVGFMYRLLARKLGDPTEEIVKSSFHVVNVLGIGSNPTPNAMTGYVSYLDTSSNMEQVLGHWTPPGDDAWQIRLEMATLGGMFAGSTGWYTIQLDNTAPRRKPAKPPFEPPEVTCEIHIDSGGDCKDFVKGKKIQGHFVARDAHFGEFSLQTLPSSMSPKTPSTPTASTWELDTTGMSPCGYVVLLEVWDRSIVNSVPNQHNRSFYDVGFCLRD